MAENKETVPEFTQEERKTLAAKEIQEILTKYNVKLAQQFVIDAQ